jgi:hemoglobin-like flavoprotein
MSFFFCSVMSGLKSGRTLLGVAGPGGAAGAAAERSAAKRDEKASAPEPADNGPVSKHTIRLVQSSWAKVFPISDAAATLFYDRLFEMEPSLRSMFKPDMREQKKKLMQTLSVAVDGLNNLPRLVPVLKDLGARHAGYMVQEHHYDLVGEALLWTLREGLGDDFTDEVELAWTEVYTLVADVMKGAAAEVGGGLQPVKTTPAGGGAPAPAPAPAQRAAAAPQAAVPLAKPSSPSEDEVETLHYDSSRRPPILDELGIPDIPSAGAQRTEPIPGVAAAPAPAAAAPRAKAKPVAQARPAAVSEPPPEIEVSPATTSVVLPLMGKEITLNVKLSLDGPLLSVPREAAAPAPETGTAGGLAPALFLATLCAIASMALATLAPELSPKLIPQLDVVSPLAVPILVLVLILAAFGLGYLWGRGRRPAGAGAGASKS